MQLRPYQIAFNTNMAKSVAQCKHVIACLPTGGGKTLCFISIAAAARAKGRTVLILSETRKIFEQITQQASGVHISAKTKHLFVTSGGLYIAMAQTLVRRPAITQQFHALASSLLIITDEAHVGTPTKLLQQLPDALRIGFTATPNYEQGKHLPELYKACVVGAQVSDLIQEGFLCPYTHYARTYADMDALRIKNGEFTEESQKAAFETNAVFDGLVDDIRNIPYRKALIFCASIEHAEDTAATLSHHNIRCVTVHSQNQESSLNLHNFMHGDIDVCVSVGVLTKGFDFPPIDLVVLLRATTSLPLYLQMCGRGSRISPATGKTRFTVLDYGSNWTRHFQWDMDREWEKMWLPTRKARKKDTVGVAPVTTCEQCQAIIPSSAVVCPYCGNIRQPQERELEQGELVEVNELYTRMTGRRISSLTPTELAIYARIKNKKPYAIRIAKAQEQRTPGWLEKFRVSMGYKPSWLHFAMPGSEPVEFHDIVLR